MKTIALLITLATGPISNSLPPTPENSLPPTWEMVEATITSIDA